MTSTYAEPDVSLAPLTVRYRALGLLVLGQLALGVLLGLLWLAWSPHSVAYNIDLGNGQGVIIPAEGESLVAADGRFVVLTAAAGVLVGLAAWRLRPLRGRLTLAVIAGSSLLASVLTKYTGQWLSGGHRTAPINTAFRPQLMLHANAALLLQALLAALVYTMFVGLTSDPQLGRPEPAAPNPDNAHFNGAETDPARPVQPSS